MLICTIPMAKSEEIVDLVIETVTFDTGNSGISAVEEAVNQITIPAIGVRVHLLDVGIQQHAQRISMMIESGNAPDLVMAGLTLPMVSMVADDLLLPLDDLVATYGQDIQATFGDLLAAGQIDHTLYAIPGDLYCARAGGLLINQELMQAAGITPKEFCTLDELDEMFAALKAYAPDRYAIAFEVGDVSAVNYLFEMENYGSNIFAFGVTLNPSESTKLENLFSSEAYRAFCHKTRQWQEKGYFPPDLLTGGILSGYRMSRGEVLCMPTSIAPVEQWFANSESKRVYTTRPLRYTSAIQERMWGIPVCCRHPEKAMAFLNLLYKDEQLANLLSNGVEGLHYTRLSPHVIQSVEGADYKRVFTRFGDQAKIDHLYPATEDYPQELLAFEKSADVSLTLGYTFDSTSVAGEIEAVTAVIASYAPALEYGLVEDVDAALTIFNDALEQAGIGRIIAENQRQLSVWLAEQEP